MMMLRGKPFDSWEEYWWFLKKKKSSCRLITRETNLAGKNLGKKNSCSQKNICHAWKKSYTIVTLEKKCLSQEVWEKLLRSLFNPTQWWKKNWISAFTNILFNLHSIIIFLGKAESGIYIKALPANLVKFGQDAKFACVAGTWMNGREREKRKKGKMHKDRTLGPLGTWRWWTVICYCIWHWYHLSRHNITRHFRKFGNCCHGLFKLFIIQFLDDNIYFFMRKSSLHVLAENQPAIAQLSCWGKCWVKFS